MSDVGSASPTAPASSSATPSATASASSPTGPTGPAASPAPALATPATATPATVSATTVSATTIAVHGNGSTLPGWGFLFLAVMFLVAVAAALPATVRRTQVAAHRRGRR